MRYFRTRITALMLLTLATLCGCATRHVVQFPNHKPDEPVRAVIFKDTPEIRSLADQARKIGNESYPKILRVLGIKESEAPAHFDIIFQNHASMKTLMHDDSGGYMKRGTIYLGVDWLTNSPEELGPYLTHEVAHVAQDYNWWRTPEHWTEGLADYAHFKLGYTNSWACAKCSAMYPHYTSGYCCTAAFLFFVEANYDPQIAVQLNYVLRHEDYSDEFFKKQTGKDLNRLWTEFQKTPAFSTSAADLLKLEDSLGYENGHPTRRTKPGAQRKIDRARSLAALAEQPGGALITGAYKFLADLRDRGQLPGWRKDEKGIVELSLNKADLASEPSYPFRDTIRVTKNRDGLVYHFTLLRESPDADWQLEKSWCTDKNNRLIRYL